MREMSPSPRSLLSGPGVYNHIMLRGRIRKDTFRCKKKKPTKVWARTNWCLVLWEELGWASVRCNGWCAVLTNSVLWWEGEWVFFIKWEKKVDIRSPDTAPLSALDCLFRADFSCKHGGRRASSSPAKPSSQMGGWPFPPLVFLFSFFSPFEIALLSIPFVSRSDL